MGLDIVELVMRTEEDFGIEIGDYDAGQVRTAGDLYQLVCRLLGVLPHPHPDELQDPLPMAKYTSKGVLTPEDIWVKLVKTIEDQLQVDLWQMLGAGFGDYPRVIAAPLDIGDCFTPRRHSLQRNLPK